MTFYAVINKKSRSIVVDKCFSEAEGLLVFRTRKEAREVKEKGEKVVKVLVINEDTSMPYDAAMSYVE